MKPTLKIRKKQSFTKYYTSIVRAITNTTNKPWGPWEENWNKVHFSDFTQKLLKKLRIGSNPHLVYGYIQHMLWLGIYTAYGISNDGPGYCLKAEGGSPYAERIINSVIQIWAIILKRG